MNLRILQIIIRWIIRSLIILFSAFFIVFAFDNFGTGKSFFDQISGFTISIIPAIAILGFLAATWRRNEIGGMVFLIVACIFTWFFHAYESITQMLLIFLPPFLISLLYFISGYLDKKIKTKII